MALSTSRRADSESAAITGLDNLEVGEGRPAAGRRIARRWWTAIWPKLLAIAIVGVAYQLFYLKDFHGDTASGLVRSPATTLSDLWSQLHTAPLWQGIATTVQTAVL